MDKWKPTLLYYVDRGCFIFDGLHLLACLLSPKGERESKTERRGEYEKANITKKPSVIKLSFSTDNALKAKYPHYLPFPSLPFPFLPFPVLPCPFQSSAKFKFLRFSKLISLFSSPIFSTYLPTYLPYVHTPLTYLSIHRVL